MYGTVLIISFQCLYTFRKKENTEKYLKCYFWNVIFFFFHVSIIIIYFHKIKGKNYLKTKAFKLMYQTTKL